MRPLLPALILLAPALHAAEAGGDPPKRGKISAVSLLPDGSELCEVMFPRYDEKRRLVGVLKAEAMTLVNDQTVSGRTISIEFFNDDQTPRGRIDLKTATFDQSRGFVEAREPVTVRSDRINANGTGLIHDLETGEGFLLGPAETWIPNPTETAMTTRPSTLRAAAAGMAIAATSVNAAAPPPLTEAEKAALQTDAASAAGDLTEAAKATRADLGSALAASDAANKSAREFLVKAELDAKETVAPEPPQAKPLEKEPGPNDTLIACDGGMYFNPDEGVFVYLKNVRVTDPRFTMKGANELKIFLSKKPEDNNAKTEKKDGPQEAKLGDDLGGKFGDVERIVATGAIVLDQKAVDGNEAIKASGAIFSYNIKADQVIISGGYPWVVRGGLALRAKEPNLTLRIQPKTGKMDTEGAWETMLPLQELQKKNP